METKARASSRTKLALGLVGLGIAVLIYGLATRGLSINLVSKLFLGVGVGALMGARRLLHESLRTTLAAVVWVLPGALVGVGASALLAPPINSLALVTHELPGLRIGLPPGTEDAVSTSYDQGKVSVAHIAGLDNLTAVFWTTGTLDEEIKAKASTDGFFASTGTRISTAEVAVGGGLRASSRLLLKGRIPGLETSFACGRRVFNVMTVGKNIEKLHRRILASVACKPDATHEAASAPEPPITVDVPAGWTLAKDAAPGVVAYEHDGQILSFGPIPSVGADVSEQVPALIEHFVGAKAIVTALPTEAGRHLWSLRKDDPPAARGMVTTWECNGYVVLGVFLAQGADDAVLARGKALLLAARCK